jgi:hypothetical protein
MKRMLVGTLAAAAVMGCAVATASAAPKLVFHVQEDCSRGTGFTAQLSGLPPNASFTLGADWVQSSGEHGVATIAQTAGPDGTFEIPSATIWFTVPLDRLTVFVVFGGVRVEQTLVRPCQPKPGTKDDCINGGWRNFPGFRNQGDCVSFVATGGKNQPSGP